MAGIGFNLEKILEGDTYFDSVKAHFYSALICSGPWLLSILTLFCLSYFAPAHMDLYELTLFRTITVYVFAYSLVVVGVIHFPLTRYVADKLYTREKDAVIPVFNTTGFCLIVVQGIIGGLFFFQAGIPPILAGLSLLIYITISLMWLLMIFLTALRDYKAIVGAYLIGSIVAVAASMWLGRVRGLEGYFIGYLGGHFVIVLLWASRILIEFSSDRIWERDFFPFLIAHSRLIFIGLFYNLALWIDKIVFWFSPHATAVTSELRVFPIYDSSVFFAYLTIIPSLSIFLLKIETDFYRQYRNFYSAIMDRATFPAIRQIRNRMAHKLRESAVLVIRYQGVLSLLVIALIPRMADFLNFPLMQIPIFRVAVVGAFLHSLLLMTIIIILYFDFQALALLVSAMFLILNGLLTWMTTQMEVICFGYGYLLAALLSLMTAYYMLDYKLKRLEYFTFAKQPVGRHREEEIT